MGIGTKEDNYLTVFVYRIHYGLHFKNWAKNIKKKLLNLISDSKKIVGNTINVKISIVFPYTRNKSAKYNSSTKKKVKLLGINV